jgi:DNA polymerase
MQSVPVQNFDEWRNFARALLSNDVHFDSVAFTDGVQATFLSNWKNTAETTAVKISKQFVELAEFVAMHRDPRRWDLLYRTAYRMTRLGERRLLENEVDPDIRELFLMQKALRRDIHKMHAFVRFRKVDDENERYVAWHRPDHFIVEHVGPWFAERFGAMHWAILTPDRSVYWNTHRLRFGPGVPKSEAPAHDDLEDLWRSYYASVFDPARVNVPVMKKELPVRHWATLPEAALIPGLLIEASLKETQMRSVSPYSAEAFLPAERSLPNLASAIRGCKGCELYRYATQPVFGEGSKKAHVMFVGEQPGDQEDLQGSPFVGPAGQILNKALAEAGIDRSKVYVTNAVKHFKLEERGKRRIHKKPRGVEVAACRPWLTAEIEEVKPEVIVALGATAALSVGGREFAIQKERGKLIPIAGGRQLLITVHPSFLLRLPEESRDDEFRRFVDDLRLLCNQ